MLSASYPNLKIHKSQNVVTNNRIKTLTSKLQAADNTEEVPCKP